MGASMNLPVDTSKVSSDVMAYLSNWQELVSAAGNRFIRPGSPDRRGQGFIWLAVVVLPELPPGVDTAANQIPGLPESKLSTRGTNC